MEKLISIVIFCNAKDYFLAKICVSSIRYFYPRIDIFLVKDELNGSFSTKFLENKFNVKIFDLSKKYFGWGAAKIEFIIQCDLDQTFLCLDADIIFVGNVLNKIADLKSDFLCSPEFAANPNDPSLTHLYFDVEKILRQDASYKYPGFFFNTGQFAVNPSRFQREYFEKVYDSNRYPYYKSHLGIPPVDQPILNYLVPVLANKGKIEIKGIHFMEWSVDFFKIDIRNNVSLLSGKSEFLIHYAGDSRTPLLKNMRGTNLLIFFHNLYLAELNVFQRMYSKMQDCFFDYRFIVKIYNIKNRFFLKYFL